MGEKEEYKNFCLSDANWHTWSLKMKAFLLKNGWWDSAAALPIGMDRGADTIKAQAEMMLRVEDQFLSIVNDAQDAKAAWRDLRSAFETQGAARRVTLRKELNNIAKKKDETISQHIDRGKTLKNELSAAGLYVPEFEVVEALLMGLPEEYEVIRQIITSQDMTSISLSQLLSKLSAIESSRQKIKEAEAMALTAETRYKPLRDVECHYCHRMGQIARHCRKKQERQGHADALTSIAREAIAM
jgi:gag-polypeptide of LTR copia-type